MHALQDQEIECGCRADDNARRSATGSTRGCRPSAQFAADHCIGITSMSEKERWLAFSQCIRA
ncbi:hypothetical protein MNO14_09605 [Luteimonas sp. S4-F44]|uniref:hypothetical protein n=1 Tax=Luteimonas sp. S4-F44 TaxID=2925842 RepID=UPI001F53A158|nr:hypothetical protein [Luteimonas sp. S4-F44]UNK41240.1 hypothetical protein MNO14_09605 [Luteimonas sp. S4-F44]